MTKIPSVVFAYTILGVAAILGGTPQSASAESPKPVVVENAPDVNLVGSDLSHMLRPVQNHVAFIVQSEGSENCEPFFGWIAHLVLADRSPDTVPYEVPSGKRLVITDVNWQAFTDGGPWNAGEFLLLEIGPSGPGAVLFRTGTVITSDLAAASYYAGNEYAGSGMVFFPGESVCLQGLRSVGAVGNTTNVSLNRSTLGGYLLDE